MGRTVQLLWRSGGGNWVGELAFLIIMYAQS